MKTLRKINFYFKKAQETPGWLFEEEMLALFKYAKDGPGQGRIVEIGSFVGKSTILLAGGSKEAERGEVCAIDTFAGSGSSAQMKEFRPYLRKGTYFRQFKKNLRAAQVEDNVIPLKTTSEKAALETWPKQKKRSIRLLFIDGNHNYRAVKKDFKLWFPYVCKQGLVLFHDAKGTPWVGVEKAVKEIRKENKKRLKKIAQIRSLAVFQKI